LLKIFWLLFPQNLSKLVEFTIGNFFGPFFGVKKKTIPKKEIYMVKFLILVTRGKYEDLKNNNN
jgi:hypothetical protein